ncbi:hypothetical protein [Pseudoxanthomonas sp. SE1]|uniref:hypothetical protein n=1 Tax=Pseudoxanthomonas sp. SE1 TaxID=1664560 RepID=UPI00240E138A|nr:hypothetical protein [Pseudoxanthomonas sp. SE1]WFC43763.1 hypothetical protein OY559_09830 [Pseudoxanthomonas sp. SE1]
MIAPVCFTVTAEHWDVLIQALAVSLLFGGFMGAFLCWDLFVMWDRFQWRRRRARRLARRRAKGVIRA